MEIENKKKKRMVARIFRRINQVRLVLINLLFLVGVIVLLVVILPVKTPKPSGDSYLLVNPQGRLVIRPTQSPLQDQLNAMQGYPNLESPILDLKRAIELASQDPQISAMVLDLSALQTSGIPMIKMLYQSLTQFKESGKKIIVHSSYLTQEHFLLCSLADEWTADPLFSMDHMGFSSHRIYWSGAFSSLGVEPHIYRAGEFKSYTEVFSQEEMSSHTREELQRWLDDLWAQYGELIHGNLNKTQLSFNNWVDNRVENLTIHEGHWAKFFQEEGWVDDIEMYDRFQSKLENRFNGDQIAYLDYLHVNHSLPKRSASIALLPLSGEIRYGEGDWGYIGSQSVVRTIEMIQARPDIQGLVLWMDSPGGSAWASEEIRRALERFKDTGRQVVLVMGNSCASGGYWIASAADHIIADSSTITGSIGVFSYLFTAQSLMEQLHLREDGYTTVEGDWTPRLTSIPSANFNQLQQAEVDRLYQFFLSLVNKSRNISGEELIQVAEGRIWTGREAVDNRLVDQEGSIEQARNWFEKHGEDKDILFEIFHEDYQFSQNPLSQWFVSRGTLPPMILKSLLGDGIISDNLLQENYSDPRGVIAAMEWMMPY